VLSPTGWGVAVDGEGRVVGVASQETIAGAIRDAHAERKGPADRKAAAGAPGGPGATGARRTAR
jgi:osmoprotectant transport system ATP-binding protein